MTERDEQGEDAAAQEGWQARGSWPPPPADGYPAGSGYETAAGATGDAGGAGYGPGGTDPAFPAVDAGAQDSPPAGGGYGEPGPGSYGQPAGGYPGGWGSGPGGWGPPPGAWGSGPGAWGSGSGSWGSGGGWGSASGSGWGSGSGGWGPGGPGWATVPPPPPSPSGRRRRHRITAAVSAVIVLAAAALGVGIGHAVWHSVRIQNAASNGGTSSPTVPGGNGGFGGIFGNRSPFGSENPFGSGGTGGAGSSGSGTTNGSGSPSDVGAIAAKVSPALVDINVTFSYQQAAGAGTGIVMTSSGEVLTNNHVINGATKISVTDIGNHQTYSASVVGYDSTNDVAVLQLKTSSGKDPSGLAAAHFDTTPVSVGEGVVAIGNAGGRGGTPTSSGGSVTAVNQSITASDQLDGTSEHLSGLIQVNADIQSGDSGGSLVNVSGAVIGMDTAASTSFQFSQSGGQGYAIPIGQALSIAKQIEAGKGSSAVHIGQTAFLGVLISPSSSQGLGSSGEGGEGGSFGGSGTFGGNGSSIAGADVSGVVTGAPAQKAGLGAGDVITSFGAQTVSSSADLTKLMVPYHPGDKVSIGWVDSSGQSHTATVTLASGPPA